MLPLRQRFQDVGTVMQGRLACLAADGFGDDNRKVAAAHSFGLSPVHGIEAAADHLRGRTLQPAISINPAGSSTSQARSCQRISFLSLSLRSVLLV